MFVSPVPNKYVREAISLVFMFNAILVLSTSFHALQPKATSDR